MYYLIIGRDHPDGFDRRQKHREAHLKGAEKLKKEGKLRYAVAIIESGKMTGSVMVMNFESEKDLETWKANEPYITGDVWDKIEITECAIPPIFD